MEISYYLNMRSSWITKFQKFLHFPIQNFRNSQILKSHKFLTFESFESPRSRHYWKSFSYKAYFNKHKNILHDGTKDFICDKCSKAFGHSSNLNKYKRTVHERIKDFHCEQCTQSFGLQNELQTKSVNCLILEPSALKCVFYHFMVTVWPLIPFCEPWIIET